MAKKSTKNPNQMAFLDHLEELRWHLIRMIIAVVAGGIVAFIFKSFIFDKVLFGPKNVEFFTYRFFCVVGEKLGISEDTCITEFPFILQSRTMSGQFTAHVWVSITAGFIIAFPFIVYELWKFISPGLHMNERKYARGFIFVTSALFMIGVLFGYYIVTPLSINFLGSYQASSQISNEFDIGSYIGLVRTSVIACGLIFELPILMYFLTRVGLVTPEFLRKYRKYALVIILIISAIITPPDIASQIIVCIPILILYEFSILISAWVIKSEKKKAELTTT